jgi:hypothetical protein
MVVLFIPKVACKINIKLDKHAPSLCGYFMLLKKTKFGDLQTDSLIGTYSGVTWAFPILYFSSFLDSSCCDVPPFPVKNFNTKLSLIWFQ